VFLDEIGDLSLKGQADLLRVLQNREYKRVGNAAIFTTNCRVIAATNKNLDDMVGKGKFREDLYYRLNMFEIKMPPLRERKDEIKFLCAHFIDKFNRLHGKKIKGISRPAKSCLFAYNWPGNVRELENVMERAIVSTTEDFIREDDLPLRLREDTEINHEEIAPLHEFEKKYVERVLSFTKGNRTECAKLLAISRRALGRKIEKLKIGKDKN
jgi:transcriptional regulator with PAS, ATPase and Fis domain